MLTIIDESTAVLVSYEGEDFVVENLSTREKVKVSPSKLISTVYKYFDGFERKFKSIFSEKDSIILTKVALRKIDDLIYFNRLDS